MTGALSAISGQFSKSLILGTFFPMVVFVVLYMLFVVPIFPTNWLFLSPIQAFDQWQIIIVLFFTIVLSGALYNLNIPLIRFYEGYPWRGSWIGRWLTRRYEAKFDYYKARWIGMPTLLYKIEESNPEDPRISKIDERWPRLGRTLNDQFPAERSLVLPTQLGNVIRSFEDYPRIQYGIDAVTLYPRLIAKIDKDYAAALDAGKTSFDFMINSSFLSAVLALSILYVGLLYPTQLMWWRIWGLSAPWFWLLEVFVFAASAYFFYCQSITAASAWGAMVKGAFDLYRWNLLDQLGYKRAPKTREEERELWQKISERMIYGKDPTPPGPEYGSPPSTYATGEPAHVALEITRGVLTGYPNGIITIAFQVKNVDTQKRNASKVIITDTVPEGFDYELGSASAKFLTSAQDAASNSAVPRCVLVIGTNPYRFELRDVPWNETVFLQYCAIPRKDTSRSVSLELVAVAPAGYTVTERGVK